MPTTGAYTVNDYWLERLSPIRRAACWELASTGRMTPEIIEAVRDERYHHAAGLVLSDAAEHQRDAVRIARQIETGEAQQ